MIEKLENPSKLSPGGWREDVHRRLSDLLEAGPAMSGGASGDAPVVVFDFDNTCIFGDIGELFSHFLIDEMRYRYDLDDFWEQIHVDDGRGELRELTEKVLAIDGAERADSKLYHQYLAQMGALYGRRLTRAGKRDCYEWAVRLHAGLTPQELTRWTAEAIERELRREIFVEERLTRHGEEVRIGRGIRLLREMHELIASLDRAGYEVWIISATNIWSVRVFGAYFGVPPERVLGNQVEIKNGILTGKTCTPVLFREGKVAIIDEVIGKRPVLVAGDSVTDYEMLCEAQELALVIDSGSTLLRSEGKKRGWAIQPQSELIATSSLEMVEKGRERR